MKKLLLCFSALLLFLLSETGAFAQHYQPFRQDLTYHYIAQDSIYSMRIDSAKVVAGDSVFVFNPIARKGGPSITNCPPPGGLYLEYAVHPNNQFGAQMQKMANGDYIFKTYQGGEFLLKTRSAIGQSWSAVSNPAVTATLASRTFEVVKNTVSDSVLTYTLSDGKIIKLSKNYGFVKAPNLSQYSDAYFKPKELEFYALPEKGLGNTISSPFAIFDFQPGDTFRYYTKHETVNNTICMEQWIDWKVTGRTNNQQDNSILYIIEEQVLTKSYGSQSAPSGFCQQPNATYLSPVDTFHMIISPINKHETFTLSQGFELALNWNPITVDNYVSKAIIKNTQYNFREQLETEVYKFDTCSKIFSPQLDFHAEQTYTVGLGLTKLIKYSMGANETTVLECYTKGTEIYGNCRSLADILAVKEDLQKQPLVQVFPNPFANELTLMFGENTGKSQLVLLNTLGQKVWQQETTTAANAEMKFNLPELPKGMYVLQVSQNDKTFTSRLVKQ